MPIPDTSGVPPFADFEMLKSKINEIVQKYNNLLVNLDTLNVLSLNAKVIEAGTITGEKIAADTITADKLNVNELSAISANLGTVTVGTLIGVLIQAATIIGSYIATSTGYPRSEMSNTGNFFAVYLDELRSIIMRSTGDNGSPQIKFNDGVTNTNARLEMWSTFDNYFLIGSNVDIRMALSDPASVVRIPSWSKLKNESSGELLQTALNNKANAFSGFTGSFTVSLSGGGSRVMTFSNGILVS